MHSKQVKTILNKTKRRDPWFLDDYTVNPYSGCSFNCLFCYTQGSKYGMNLEEKVTVKDNAPELLHKQLGLRAKKGAYGIIVLSSATDPYLHFEKERGLTRELLGVIHRHRFPVHIITRSNLVTRDLDILQQIGRDAILPPDLEDKLQHKAIITFSFSTLDDEVANVFEPGATPPSLRLAAMQEVLAGGSYSGVSLMPLLPYITDTAASLEQLFSTFSRMGAHYLFPASIHLSGQEQTDNRHLMLRAVEKHYPHLLEKYQRFFTEQDEPPIWYRQAFYKKMEELSQKYKLKNSLLTPGHTEV